MNEDRLKRVLDRLEARLDRIERQLGIEPEAATPQPPAPPPAPPPVIHAPPPPARPATPPVAPPVAPTPHPFVPPAHRPARIPARRPAAARDTRTGKALELRIGQSWLAWVGAIVIVVGAAFLVKLGYEEGWWAALPALTRCLAVAAFGALLAACGELALRRIGVAASVGLFGAGLGILYLDAYAAFALFQPPIVTREWAFALMAVVALAGFGITVRTRFLTIGVLSILGGYLTPWLLRGGTAHVVEIGAFLTMLLAVSLALSSLLPRPFRALRYVALAGHALVGLGWVVGAVTVNWVAVLVLVTIWWVAVLAEVLFAAMRRQSAVGNVVAILLSTAWFVVVGCRVLALYQPAGYNWLGVFTFAVAALAAALAAMYGPPLSGLARPRVAIDALAVALWAQAAVLLTVAVALQFDAYGQSIGWLAIGLGAVEVGRRLRLRALDVFGLVVGALGIARVALIDWRDPVLAAPLLVLEHAVINGWSILALVAVLATHLAARRLRDVWRAMPVVLASLGTLGWLALWAVQCRDLTVTGGWLAGAIVLIGLQQFGRRQAYLEIGMVVLWVTAAKWLLVDAVLTRTDPGWDPSALAPLLNGQMGMAAAIVLVGWWSSRVLARRAREAPQGYGAGSIGWQLAFAIGSAFLLVAVSFELDRIVGSMQARGGTAALPLAQLRGLLFTMLWALGTVGIGFIARALIKASPDALAGARPSLLVRFAWLIVGACAIKWLIGDTLYWATLGRGVSVAWPLLNLQMLAGVVVAGSAVLLQRLTAPAGDADRAAWTSPGALVKPAAALLLLWGLSFELERAIGRYEAGREIAWSALHLRALWITLLWAAGGLAMMLWTRWRFAASMIVIGWAVLLLSAVAWLSYDTLGLRMAEGVAAAPVGLNLQVLAGAAIALMVAVALRMVHRGAARGSLPVGATVRLGLVLIGLIGLWAGSLEIDRFFAPQAGRTEHGAMARQTGLSIYWGLYAVGLIALGFARRSAACRWAGLGLIAVTLGKVVTIDMAEVGYVWRVVSFIGVGLLLVVTSVAYAKLAPRIGVRDSGPGSAPLTPEP